MKWILILQFWSSTFYGGDPSESLGMLAVPGFSSFEECQTAGKRATTELSGNLRKFSCVSQGRR